MKPTLTLLTALLLEPLATLQPAVQASDHQPVTAHEDSRAFSSGWKIPSVNYCDQPYIVVTKDGHWVCLLTTGPGKEGEPGQHVAATISTDQGRTWTNLIAIEPASGPYASWGVPLITPSGRIYAFYTYNGDIPPRIEFWEYERLAILEIWRFLRARFEQV